jgi:UDP-N-acetylglucosamine enolpyruvyl transferase
MTPALVVQAVAKSWELHLVARPLYPFPAMSTFEIEGGVPLRGTVRASGNKNAILPMIAACILTDQEVVLDNVPDIIDVRHMLDVIVALGGKVERSGERISIHVASVNTSEISRELCNKVRTSILCVAPSCTAPARSGCTRPAAT